MADELINEAYDGWHERLRSTGDVPSPMASPWYRSVYEAIAGSAAASVLEIGCGRGEFAIWISLSEPQLEVTGLDFSAAAIRIANEYAASKSAPVTFVQGNAEALPFPDDSFDLVISCECMEHVPCPQKMAHEMARVTRPGGRFCLTTPSQLNGMLLAWLKSWVTRTPYNSGAGVQPRENFYFFWTVGRYLRNAGLIVERMESSNYQWLLLPRVAPARLCTTQFSSEWARRLAFPFGLHFSFFGRKPLAPKKV